MKKRSKYAGWEVAVAIIAIILTLAIANKISRHSAEQHAKRPIEVRKAYTDGIYQVREQVKRFYSDGVEVNPPFVQIHGSMERKGDFIDNGILVVTSRTNEDDSVSVYVDVNTTGMIHSNQYMYIVEQEGKEGCISVESCLRASGPEWYGDVLHLADVKPPFSFTIINKIDPAEYIFKIEKRDALTEVYPPDGTYIEYE